MKMDNIENGLKITNTEGAKIKGSIKRLEMTVRVPSCDWGGKQIRHFIEKVGMFITF